MMEEELMDRIYKLENELKSTKYLVIFLILMFIILAYQYISVQQKNTISVEMVRTRGLVIQDQKGNDVILMGYPIPYSEARKRTDPVDGFLMVDKNGTDRLFMGKAGALQVNGELFNRIDQGWGFMVNDSRGNERGHFSMLDSLNSIILGMDYPTGEGIMVVAQPDNAFIVINADTSGTARERIILRHEMNGTEENFIKIGNEQSKGRVIIRASDMEDPSLIYRKMDGTENDLLR
jgi:hypothetical protein